MPDECVGAAGLEAECSGPELVEDSEAEVALERETLSTLFKAGVEVGVVD